MNELNLTVAFCWVVTGRDSDGVWWLGPGLRKVSQSVSASHFSSFDTAQRHATKLGGWVVKSEHAK